ncbi:TonB-dependent receptor plug domain-containing protein [Algoriphagus sp. H41]|uniref:TonB-dependent receptor plug domain-containing protein n=1 Tax=Algoriphagus oliviformis TaxID=2811231 RepID=A0ABS3C828_9BACT|nr:TonB-dependent receptor plug domain-containing protein [Algoriphagus oliviformis]MBN7813274.1 TonB-dependent receptor plug domain-containing protein [Algoriphagus oliviformis]
MAKPLKPARIARVTLGILAFFLLALSQDSDPLPRIIASFQRYVTELPQEKVYLHLDRTYYGAGETIWLKAYLVEGPNHQLSALSSTVYVELIDSQGHLIDHVRLFSPSGLAAGQLDLPDSLSSGDYLIRAYTHWMRNVGEEYFFHRQVAILGKAENPNRESVSENALDIQFFPEGGDLVEGILSKVAFKVLGKDGLGIKVKGEILENGKPISSFESNALGMGAFPLLPKAGNTYSARIDSRGQELALPAALESGIVMAVTNSPKSPDLGIKIQPSDAVPFKNIYLLAQTRGLVCASSQVDLSNRIAFVKIPKTEFPTGIAQITAVDEDGNPLAERLVYIDHPDELQITISAYKATYFPRDSVRIDILTQDRSGKPVSANLSISVFDSGQIGLDENSETIQSNLLLSSELKGHIESPGYYFNPKNEDRAAALDILMLTQGWRKFTIKQALDQDLPEPKYRIEKGLAIRGELRDKSGQPASEGTVSYLSLYPITQSITASSDSNGKFEMHDLIFFDSAQVSLEGKSSKGRGNMDVILDESYELPSLARPVVPARAIASEGAEAFLQRAEERRQIAQAFDFEQGEVALDEVQVKGKKIAEVEEYTGPKLYGGGSAKIQVAGISSLENQQHPLELVRGRVAGVQVSGSGTEWRVLIQGVGSINSSTEPLIMVDDIPIDLKSLHTIPVQEIESFTVWKGPDTAIFGSRGANGAIGFYTKRSKEGSKSPTGPSPTMLRIGYQAEREFYSPRYPAANPNLAKPDRRATLLWAPHIQTDTSGRASVTFFNHDLETTITCQIEGMTESGKPGAARFQYRISQK